MFSGQELANAFEKGAEAAFNTMVESVEELMRYDDAYEAYKFLYYYGKENGYNVDKLIEKLGY